MPIIVCGRSQRLAGEPGLTSCTSPLPCRVLVLESLQNVSLCVGTVLQALSQNPKLGVANFKRAV